MFGSLRSKRRVGWIITDLLERRPWVRESWYTGGGVGLARYGWFSEYINHHVSDWHYELYRPWRSYDTVVFLKSMRPRAQKLLERLQEQGIPCVFDANVNYFDHAGTEYYTDMLPSQTQRLEVEKMVRSATAVIADSEFIRDQCQKYNPHTTWIPDVVDVNRASFQHWSPNGSRLRLLWSGQAVKLFELLAAEEILLSWKDRLELVLVTNDLGALQRLYPQVRKRLETLLASLSVTIIPYRSINQLFSVYNDGGVFISPRYLDNRYNFGHTEWKITLAMACGRIALCSPVPSYKRVAERSDGSGIRVCQDSHDWSEAFEELLVGRIDWGSESTAAREVVEQYYSPAAIASDHLNIMKSAMARQDQDVAGL